MMITMAAQKNLHELLEQDQEPFLLKNYIADRRSRLKNHLRRRRRPNDGAALHIPEPTSVLLLEAAMRIHKPKSKVSSVGIFDSIFNKLGNRKNRASAKKSSGISIGSEKSLDFELESCCTEHIPATATATATVTSSSTYFCSSPQSPFRLSLFRTPEFSSSPEASSGRNSKEGEEENEIYHDQTRVEEEEEKKQCSPVSVLEPLFEDEEDKIEDYEPKMECYAIMQKAKHQLLEKLRRFERLAQLDPLELDKTLFEDEYDNVTELEEEQQQLEEDCFIMEVISESDIVVGGIKRLVFDLIEEEKVSKEEEVTKRVLTRLEKWKEAKRESIDMMVEMDLRRERIDGWKRIVDEKLVKDVGKEIGFAILGELIDELLQ